ncbi:hypothetical protein R3W88_032110 [Solanum pinnatisectum]|uniref:AIPP2-like SPOC-like domain-containing protein n=1 Tax=Solanum pinnatisectum TaxID=50273 RepID=A0AAV9LNH9_9SOLN|nr:hypothetical protein R3W88_032110 [Solanum pinnatisectum]
MTTHSPMQKEPNNIHQPNMKKICEICGDLGIQEAIITCYQYAPVDWRCEECDIRKGVIFSLCGLENECFKESKLHASTKICQSTVQPKKHNKFPRRQLINWEKEVRTGKTRYLLVEEALHVSRNMDHCQQILSPQELCEPNPENLASLKPSLFDNHCPGKEDIGLYFFGSERKRSRRYIDLVEFMHNKDLVMRTLINDVELFILASTTLCSDSQKWNNEHFLWGLFYRMRQDTDRCAEGKSNKVIDMEIDMIGGRCQNEVEMR